MSRPIPTIETPRLRLRGWSPSDTDDWQRICADAETMRYIGDGTPMPDGRSWYGIAFLLGHWALRGYGMWAVEDARSGALLGRVGLHHPAGWPGLELGWLLDRGRWGEGLATEAAGAAAAWTFETLDAPRLISLIRPENVASIRVAEKLGARFDERITMDGSEVLVYALDRSTIA